MRDEILAKHKGDLGKEGEDQLKSAVEVSKSMLDETEREKVEARGRVDIFESAFRKIKEATGVINLT